MKVRTCFKRSNKLAYQIKFTSLGTQLPAHINNNNWPPSADEEPTET